MSRISALAWERNAWLGAWACWFVLRFLASPRGLVADEELHTPTVAAVLSGRLDPTDLPDLQYMSYCGGCTVEALAVLPAFATLGPSLVVWKMVPLAFGLGILAACWQISLRLAGPTAARVCAAALLFGPIWWSEGSTIAFGSHFEVMLPVLLGVLAWRALLAATDAPRRALPWGLWSGLGLWFHYGSAFAPPVLGLLWLVHRVRNGGARALPREGAWAALGTIIGLLPWVWTRLDLRNGTQDQPAFEVYGQGVGDLLGGAPVLQRLDELVGPAQWASAWYPVLDDAAQLPGLWTTAVAAGAVAIALALGLSGLRQKQAPPLGLALALLCVAYAGCYIALAPAAFPVGDAPPYVANDLRYALPLVPLVCLCMGWVAHSAHGWRGPLRAAMGVGIGGALAVGFTAGMGQVRADMLQGWGLGRAAIDRDTILPRPAPLDLAADWYTENDRDLLSELDHQLADLPSKRAGGHGRALALGAVGYHVFGRIVVTEAERGGLGAKTTAALSRIAQLDGPDLADLAVGTSLLWAHTGGWIPQGISTAPPHYAQQFLDLAPPALSAPMFTELLCREPVGPSRAWRQSLDAGETPPDGQPSPWTLALAAAVGVVSTDDTNHYLPDPAAAMGRAESRALRLPPALARAVRVGAAQRLGVRMGPSRAVREIVLMGTPASERQAVGAAYDEGVRRVAFRPPSGP